MKQSDVNLFDEIEIEYHIFTAVTWVDRSEKFTINKQYGLTHWGKWLSMNYNGTIQSCHVPDISKHQWIYEDLFLYNHIPVHILKGTWTITLGESVSVYKPLPPLKSPLLESQSC